MGKKTDVPARRTRSHTSTKVKMATNSDRATDAMETGITADVIAALVDQMKNMAAHGPDIRWKQLQPTWSHLMAGSNNMNVMPERPDYRTRMTNRRPMLSPSMCQASP